MPWNAQFKFQFLNRYIDGAAVPPLRHTFRHAIAHESPKSWKANILLPLPLWNDKMPWGALRQQYIRISICMYVRWVSKCFYNQELTLQGISSLLCSFYITCHLHIYSISSSEFNRIGFRFLAYLFNRYRSILWVLD